MVALLDVSVLVALLNQEHIFHQEAIDWFRRDCDEWSSCAVTELGMLRVLMKTTEPRQGALEIFRAFQRLKEIRPWVAFMTEPRLTDRSVFLLEGLEGSAQTTDAYLIGVACANGGAFATFDRRLKSVLPCVVGAREQDLILL